MHFKKTFAAAIFGVGVTSVMAQCREVKTGMDEDIGAIYATGLTGEKLLAVRYRSRTRYENFSVLMYDICSEMEFCAHQPLTNGQCFEDGSDMIDTLINESTATDEVLRGIQDFTNTLLAKDGQWEAESGGKGEGLRQSADDMLNNAMSAQDFLDEEF